MSIVPPPKSKINGIDVGPGRAGLDHLRRASGPDRGKAPALASSRSSSASPVTPAARSAPARRSVPAACCTVIGGRARHIQSCTTPWRRAGAGIEQQLAEEQIDEVPGGVLPRRPARHRHLKQRLVRRCRPFNSLNSLPVPGEPARPASASRPNQAVRLDPRPRLADEQEGRDHVRRRIAFPRRVAQGWQAIGGDARLHGSARPTVV